jgi:ArsR family transcriptional regulator, arsenate/arsenite/antimonite-responsive transcriptional repressor
METKAVVRALGALAQESRLAVYRLLVEAGPRGRAVGEIAQRLEIANATLSFHLKELANAGLIAARQEGRFIYYSANYAGMNELLGFLTENCCGGDAAACAPYAAASKTPTKLQPAKLPSSRRRTKRRAAVR